MIVSDKEAASRLASPSNLINRLRQSTRSEAMQLFTGPASQGKMFNPFERKEVSSATTTTVELSAVAGEPHPAENTQPTLDTILQDSESQIKLGLAHDKSLSLLMKSVDLLESKLDDVSASKLPAVIGAASKVVESIRKERMESSKNSKDREVHYHFYTPSQKKLEDFEVIDVT